MLEAFLIPFLTIGLAELGDKTQLAVICLSSKTDRHLRLFMGVMLAFMIADGGAILLGGYLTALFPETAIRFISGIVFVFFGLLTIIRSREGNSNCEIRRPFLTGFSMILLSEMGDKTQIASAVFGARYNPLFVFIGVISALAILTAAAILLGRIILNKLNRRIVSVASGIVFLIVGMVFVFFG